MTHQSHRNYGLFFGATHADRERYNFIYYQDHTLVVRYNMITTISGRVSRQG